MAQLRYYFILLLLLSLFIPVSCTFADPNFAQRKDVQEFIDDMVKKNHFKKDYLVSLFSAVKLRPQVIRHMNKPLEKESWSTYQRAFITESRIKNGVIFWNKYTNALQQAEQIYHIPAAIIVATIGIESKYGERIGQFRVIDSLSNIAFSSSSRAPFFRQELREFLMLTREQHLDPLKVMGSYAGAIGQPQFMPSSYRYYAVNFSKSGKIDLMNNEVDVIGSIANYYSKHGWRINEPVAVPAVIVGDRYHYLSSKAIINQPFLVSDLLRYGIVPKDKILQDNLKVKVIELSSHYSKEYWLGFHNFAVIKRYNSSDLYAMAVYQLSTLIKALKERKNV